MKRKNDSSASISIPVALTAAVLVLLALIAALLLPTPLGAQARSDVLRVGIAVPLSGPTARVGDETSKVAEWWAKKVRAEHGVKVEVVVRDTTFKPADAIAAVERLVEQDKVSAIAGIWHSSQGVAVVPVIHRLKVPLVLMGSSSPKVMYGDNEQLKEFAWRPSIDERMKGNLVGAFVINVVAPKFGRTPKVFYVGEDTEFGRDFLDATRVYIDKHGKGKVQNVGTPLYHPQNAATLIAEIAKVRASGAEIIVAAPGGAVGALFTNEFRKLKVPALDIGYEGGAATTEYADLTGENRWGTTFYVYYTPGKPMTAKTLAWEAEFNKEVPGFRVPSSFSAILWECLETIRHAAQIAGSTDPAKINAAIPKVKFEGVRNRVVQYDPKTHDSTEMFLAMAQYQPGAPGLGFRIVWPDHVKDAKFFMPTWVKR